MKIYKPSMEDFVAEALLSAVERPIVYLQAHVETESDERRQPDGSLLVTPVNAVSVLATTWNREGRVIAWQIAMGCVYYRCDPDTIRTRFRELVTDAEIAEARIREALNDHFDVRRGVLSDLPVYGSHPAWLRGEPC